MDNAFGTAADDLQILQREVTELQDSRKRLQSAESSGELESLMIKSL